MRNIRKNGAVALIAGAFLLGPGGDAEAGGFFVRQQSTSAQSSAFAGASARGVDPSHMFYNPATIADNPGANLTIDARIFFPEADISVGSATSLLGQNVTRRGDSGGMADPAVAPGLFGSMALSENWFVGVGVTAPFAVVIETNPTWAGQFQLVRTDMTTYNVNPVLAWRALPGLTISGGLQVQHFEVDLRKTEILPVGFFVFAEALGFLQAEDTGVGATAGVLLEPADGIRIGFGYRSSINHDLEGSAGVDLTGVPVDTAFTDVTLPQVASLGIETRLTDWLTILAEIQWVDWSVFKGFVIDFGSGRPTEIRAQEWRDTWFYSGGARIKLGERTELSAGVSYDQGISTGSGNTLSPDGNRKGVSLGLNHDFSERVSANLSYMHLYLADSAVDTRNQSGTLLANFDSDLDIVGFSVTFKR